MPNATETLGTGETYTTIQAWQDDLDANDQYTGECKGEVFARVSFFGGTYTATKYPHLTVQSGAEHDGRAHEVSAAGNARIEYSGGGTLVYISDDNVRVSWLDMKGPGNNTSSIIFLAAEGTIFIHHNILHNNHANAGHNKAIYPASAADARIYRNVVYGTGYAGIYPFGGVAGSVIHCNTIYECNYWEDAFAGGIRTGDTDYIIMDNASFDNPNVDILGVDGTLDYNATSDGTGDDEGANGIANLTTADQFVDPTTTWADTDLLVKAGADLIGAGTTFSAETYPEIDVSIDKGATRATITGAWDIGAAQYVAVAGGLSTSLLALVIGMWIKRRVYSLIGR